ncbi:GntR family transcriptional regulator [Melissococcus plutonius]|uniref:Predicted transcriptional regulator of N-acetylglucosamine utilization, GntR family n=1 Tax=Melissococcus plutonius (strain ATCC 35311 / DSM 29964 / CIP 104052 / LMG 20360 / NCIMB 702443) TaxID=940190 RepID=F3Y8R3_MELPT|nr:GntR family transcriptional regulator [Melissococcus plutonius]AIM24554.1 HTH-type transcriptional repressor YvoA [Melissococcus plutonius S1]KMT24621.1 HTH-type transcriptional repressor YvoA [Melissococcus plutonius]KMT27334.1 HTH-type transcriptional repressor YvoA [Melissococcus plutonius]KMT27507.1 HTH-type transcriptional repressor YvoA [Melissococcus plutonius]KMT29281.1 HTH-type transcriptional repressor YvoA [Melissococcus plutonius]
MAKKNTLYCQLVDTLKNQINNELVPHSKLLSEREISKKYGVSRMTVRLALNELEQMGYVYKQHGKGTFVSDLKGNISDISQAYSFTEQMRDLGKVPQTEVLEFNRIESSSLVSQQLNLSSKETVFKLKRLRMADDIPLMIEDTYLPAKRFFALNETMIKQKPLYDLFAEDFDQKIRLADEEFYASIANQETAEHLRIREGALILNFVRTTYNTQNEVIEFTTSSARADQFHYKVRHIRNKT